MSEDLKQIIADNISELRRVHGVTQAELAEELNYTDKAVSKWERGESIPDVTVLKSIADKFGVSVDYLLSKTHNMREDRARAANHFTITAISFVLVYALATIVYFVLKLALTDTSGLWRIYVAATPIASVLLLVLNSVWGKIKLNYPIVTLLVWSMLLTAFVFYTDPLVFVLGIPAQVIIVLWSRFKFNHFKKEKTEHSRENEKNSDVNAND